MAWPHRALHGACAGSLQEILARLRYGNRSRQCPKASGRAVTSRQKPAATGIYFFLRLFPVAVFSIAKSSNFFPSLIAATSHRGFAPLPAHVLPALSRYFGGTFFPLNTDPPRPLLGGISSPNLASWLRSSVPLRLSSFPTSSRNCKSCSTDIEPRFVLTIGYLPTKKAPSPAARKPLAFPIRTRCHGLLHTMLMLFLTAFQIEGGGGFASESAVALSICSRSFSRLKYNS